MSASLESLELAPAPDHLGTRIAAVVMGASAGGIEALGALLPALPPDSSAAVLIVLHLLRERPSMLAEIFSSRCALPVSEAQDKEPVLAGRVYFAPPDYHLLVDRGPQLALSVDEPVHFSRPSIDVLFESAADIYGAALLGIILSGANEDGTAGLAAVRRAGGLTVVQQPDSAAVPYMVRSALASGAAELTLTLPQIAAMLGSLRPSHDRPPDQR
ncbi:MAG TPA: chemotaxis protein CheB [Steroidobacteraceae bacterium]|jgi:two-component system chemotaxis response regulator CheB|nr:chemotaxis protein CheB [Steroidobacteraceae bacterium]